MSEHINNLELLGSGGHVWLWGSRNRVSKLVGVAGTAGEEFMQTQLGARPGRIAGRNGRPGILKGFGETNQDADADLTAKENAIEALCDGDVAVPWEDDRGRSGPRLIVNNYNTVGERTYGNEPEGQKSVWQFYTLDVIDLDGAWATVEEVQP